MNRAYGAHSRLLIVLLLCLFFSVSCSRQEVSLVSVDMKPLVAVTHRPGRDSLLSEGAVVLLTLDGTQEDTSFQMQVSSPDEQLVWERMVKPFSDNSLWYVTMNDLLLPPDISLPEGTWHMRLYQEDGVVLTDSFQFSGTRGPFTDAQLAIAFLDELSWENDGEHHKLSGTSDRLWQYQFITSDGVVIHRSTDLHDPLITDGSLKKRTQRIIATTFDEQLGVYLMIRQGITPDDLLTASADDE